MTAQDRPLWFHYTPLGYFQQGIRPAIPQSSRGGPTLLMYHWRSWAETGSPTVRWPNRLALYIKWSCILARSRNGLDGRDNAQNPRGGGPPAPPEASIRTPAAVCPWCGSTDTVRVQRGFVGPTDDRNQYLTCNGCDRLTFEIISKTVRDMRVGQFRVGGAYRDTTSQTRYTITRVLKVGINECLLYVKPRTETSAERD